MVELQMEKTHKVKSVAYLVFNSVIGEIVQLLQHQYLERQHHVLWSLTLALFVVQASQVWTKSFPVYQHIKRQQRIAPLSEIGCARL